MPILMPSDTRTVLRANAEKCESRSLFMDCFAAPGEKDSGDHHLRRDWFNALRGKPVIMTASAVRCEWLTKLTTHGQGRAIFAQLQSRLMVNMAGGVMENAGLCLDRFGLPYIPGSAVKACARRMAIQALLEQSRDHKPPEDSADLLAEIALVFGWGDADWKPERRRKRQGNGWIETEPLSDFWWAMADDSGDHSADAERNARWADVAEQAASVLVTALRTNPREPLKPLAPQLPNFAGSVSFLSAFPIKAGATELPMAEPPDLGALDLDVVTCHHGDYYSDPEPNAKASDTEEPVPVVFPAVAAGHVFVFTTLPLRACPQAMLESTCSWLSSGLETFGLGAKTNSGYGWFTDVTAVIRDAEGIKRKEQAERDRQAKENADREAARASLQADEALIEKLRGMREPDLRGQINPFATEGKFWTQKDERVQLTLLHFFLVTAPDLLAADRANPKSKISKAIANLSVKFPHVGPITS